MITRKLQYLMSLPRTSCCLLLMVWSAAAPAKQTLWVWEDPSGTATPAYVLENKERLFQPRDDAYVGSSPSTWWVKVTVTNQTPLSTSRFIVYPYQRGASIDAFRLKDGMVQATKAGSVVPVAERTVKTAVSAFGINLAPMESQVVLLRIRASEILWLNYDLLGYGGLIKAEQTLFFKLIAALTIVAVLMLVNLVDGITYRSPVYIYYLGYLTMQGVLALERFGGWELYGSNPGLLSGATGGAALLCFMMVLRHLLSNRTEAVFQAPFWLAWTVTVLVIIGSLLFSDTGTSLYRSGLGIVIALCLTWCIAYAWYKDTEYAPLVMLGWFFLFLGSIASSLIFRGILGPQYTGAFVFLGLCDAIIFSVILAAKINSDRQRQTFEAIEKASMERTTQLALIGEQSAVVSHELKQPLNAIKLSVGNMTRALNKGAADVQEKWPEKLARIDKLVDRAVELTDHVRRSSRQSQGDQPRSQLGESLLGLKLMMGQDLAASNIELREHVPESLPELAIHPLRFDQVLLNIVANARDVIRTVDPEARWIRISGERLSDGQVAVAIEDSAGGIPDHLIDKVFDKFFTTKDAATGTGLGLSVCKSIIEDVGGSLSVTNTENGARFQVSVPSVSES